MYVTSGTQLTLFVNLCEGEHALESTLTQPRNRLLVCFFNSHIFVWSGSGLF
jgi:hypothetical protein